MRIEESSLRRLSTETVLEASLPVLMEAAHFGPPHTGSRECGKEQ